MWLVTIVQATMVSHLRTIPPTLIIISYKIKIGDKFVKKKKAIGKADLKYVRFLAYTS